MPDYSQEMPDYSRASPKLSFLFLDDDSSTTSLLAFGQTVLDGGGTAVERDVMKIAFIRCTPGDKWSKNVTTYI
jgi:hypothetical protein